MRFLCKTSCDLAGLQSCRVRTSLGIAYVFLSANSAKYYALCRLLSHAAVHVGAVTHQAAGGQLLRWGRAQPRCTAVPCEYGCSCSMMLKTTCSDFVHPIAGLLIVVHT